MAYLLPAKWKIGLLEVDCWKQSILLHWLLIDSTKDSHNLHNLLSIHHHLTCRTMSLTFLSYICLSQPKTKNNQPVKLTTGP